MGLSETLLRAVETKKGAGRFHGFQTRRIPAERPTAQPPTIEQLQRDHAELAQRLDQAEAMIEAMRRVLAKAGYPVTERAYSEAIEDLQNGARRDLPVG